MHILVLWSIRICTYTVFLYHEVLCSAIHSLTLCLGGSEEIGSSEEEEEEEGEEGEDAGVLAGFEVETKEIENGQYRYTSRAFPVNSVLLAVTVNLEIFMLEIFCV